MSRFTCALVIAANAMLAEENTSAPSCSCDKVKLRIDGNAGHAGSSHHGHATVASEAPMIAYWGFLRHRHVPCRPWTAVGVVATVGDDYLSTYLQVADSTPEKANGRPPGVNRFELRVRALVGHEMNLCATTA